MAENNYFFVDGSSLITDVIAIKKSEKELKLKKLDIVKFYQYFCGEEFAMFHYNSYKRFVVYFVKHENRIDDNIIIPSFNTPGAVADLQIKKCGKRIPGGSAIDAWISKHNPPNNVLDRLNKSEKAVDTQICCDALQLASYGKLERLFIYTNDYYFVPLCQTLKSMGSNISLFRLREKSINKALAQECDSFSVVQLDKLISLFS
ncbi:MAG: NYN domain-containing protein [Dehalococcoidales bacterium]|nr:NYN domain-containing protein [Dehalococcoidales bacterium]